MISMISSQCWIHNRSVCNQETLKRQKIHCKTFALFCILEGTDICSGNTDNQFSFETVACNVM
jgi:hypothetical protein